MKEQRDEGGGRILLGDNTSDGAVMPRTIGFRCAALWISTGLPSKYMYLPIFTFNCQLQKRKLHLRRTFRNVAARNYGNIRITPSSLT